MKLSIRVFRNLGIAALGLIATSATASAPVAVTVLHSSPDTAHGLVFLTPTSATASNPNGAEIVDGEDAPSGSKSCPAA